MNVDLLKLAMTSKNSSLKVWKEDTGSISLSAIGSGGGSQWKTITIPHGYSSDNLIWQVGFRETDGGSNNIMTPFESGDGRLNAFSTLDATNLYINIGWTSLTSLSATSFDYIYRLLIP